MPYLQNRGATSFWRKIVAGGLLNGATAYPVPDKEVFMGLQVPETRIFLESGDPGETARAIELLGFLDGQMTCPPLMEQAADAILGREASRKMDLDQYVSFYRRNLGQT